MSVHIESVTLCMQSPACVLSAYDRYTHADVCIYHGLTLPYKYFTHNYIIIYTACSVSQLYNTYMCSTSIYIYYKIIEYIWHVHILLSIYYICIYIIEYGTYIHIYVLRTVYSIQYV